MAIPVWTAIPDARLAPDEPVRSVDALAFRDNPLAIAKCDDGDPDPHIETAGIRDAAVTGSKIDWATVSPTLLSLGGIGYNNGTAAFDRYSWYANRNTNPGDDTRLFSHPNNYDAGRPRIYIPAAATKISISISGACTNAGLAAVGINVTVNGVTAEFRNLPTVANADWQAEVEITPGATGLQLVAITARNLAASGQIDKVVYIYGITIRVSG